MRTVRSSLVHGILFGTVLASFAPGSAAEPSAQARGVRPAGPTQRETPKAAAAPHSSDRVLEALDRLLRKDVERLWATWAELEANGLLDNRRVVVFPPLTRDAKSHRAGERAVELVQKLAPLEALVLHGDNLKRRLWEGSLGTSDVQDANSALAAARQLQAGFVVMGSFHLNMLSSTRRFEVRLRGQRPHEDVADHEGELCVAEQGTAAFAPLRDACDEAPEVPFGSTGTPRPQIKEHELFRRYVKAAWGDFAQRLPNGAGIGACPLDAAWLLPIADERDRVTGLSDALAKEIAGVAEPAVLPDDLGRVFKESGEALSRVFDDPMYVPKDSNLDRDACRLRIVYGWDGSLLTLVFRAHRGPRTSVPYTARIDAELIQGYIEGKLGEVSSLGGALGSLDGEELLSDAYSRLLARLLDEHGPELKGRLVRVLPVQTHETAPILRMYGQMRLQLAAERREVERLASERDVPIEKALRSEGAAFPVRIDYLRSTFASHDEAVRVVMYYSFANVEQHPAFELGSRIVQPATQLIRAAGATQQQADAQLTPIEIDLDNPRAKPGAVGSAREVTHVYLREPDFVIAGRIYPIGRQQVLEVELVDYARPSVAGDSEQHFFRGTIASAVRDTIQRQSVKFDPRTWLQPAAGEALSPASPLEALRDPLSAPGLRIDVRYEGQQGKAAAGEVVTRLRSFPFDLAEEACTSEAFDRWPALPVKMERRAEIWHLAGDPVAKHAAMALHGLLTNGEHVDAQSQSLFVRLVLTVREVDDLGPLGGKATLSPSATPLEAAAKTKVSEAAGPHRVVLIVRT